MVVTQQTPTLFKPIKVGRMALQHRVVLAPWTRFRAYASHVPGPQQAFYYAQRGSTPGSLLITEATFMSHDVGGYVHVPGIYTEEQIQAWKTVCGSFFRPFSSYLTVGQVRLEETRRDALCGVQGSGGGCSLRYGTCDGRLPTVGLQPLRQDPCHRQW